MGGAGQSGQQALVKRAALWRFRVCAGGYLVKFNRVPQFGSKLPVSDEW